MVLRRRFLQAAAAAPLIVPRHVLGGRGHVPPSDKVNVALVGAGGQGRSNLHGLFKLDDVQVVAVADPAEHWDMAAFYYRGVAGRKPIVAEIEKHYAEKTPNSHCSEYDDFRALLEKEKGVDAVLCATPDHLHAYVSTVSMRAGKHVYCEKPLTHDISEARRVAAVAAECKVATQMGNQGHSSDGIRQTVEWIQSGAIGAVRQVHAWVGASRWNPSLTSKPSNAVPTPAGLNWDLWLGPREPRPFHPAYAPVAWRDFWAFGCGTLGDFGCHDLDAACWALDLRHPTSVEVIGAGGMDGEIGPHGEIGYYEFPARGDLPAVKLTWYGGGIRPQRPEGWPEKKPMPSRGVLFVGDKGQLYCGGAGGAPMLLPESRMADFKPPEPTLERSRGHHRDWIDAIKTGKPACSAFEYGSRLTEIVLLGVLSLRTKTKVNWNAQTMEATGAPALQPYIREPRRAGWELA